MRKFHISSSGSTVQMSPGGQTSGTGLGLSIAKWIIDEHDGSVEVSTREGEGTTFIVWLPIAFLEKINQV